MASIPQQLDVRSPRSNVHTQPVRMLTQAFARKQHDKRGSEGAANVAAALGVAVAAARRELKDAEAGVGRQQGAEGAEPRKDAIVDDLSRCCACCNPNSPQFS